MMEDISSKEGFMEVSSRYLSNASPLGIEWGWIAVIGIIVIFGIIVYLYIKKRK